MLLSKELKYSFIMEVTSRGVHLEVVADVFDVF